MVINTHRTGRLLLPDFTVADSITTPQVDANAYVEILQSTANINITIAVPTVIAATEGMFLVVANTGTVPVSVNSNQIDPTKTTLFVYSATGGWKNFNAATADSVVTAPATGAYTIPSWNTTVLLPSLTGNLTLTYPTAAGNIGKKISLIQIGTPNSFTFTHTPQAGQTITTQNNFGEITSGNGALTVQATSATEIRQLSNIGTSPQGSERGEIIIANGTTVTTTLADVPGTTFNLPSAGTWEVEYIIYASMSTGSASLNMALTDSANLAYGNALADIWFNSFGAPGVHNCSQKVIITTSAAKTVKLRAQTSGNVATLLSGITLGGSTGSSKIIFNKVAGQLPVTGNTVDYITANLNAFQTGIAAPVDVIFNSYTAGNIPLNTSTGVFTLSAGKTYELDASLAVFINSGTPSASVSATYQWVDAGTNTALVTGKGSGISTPSTISNSVRTGNIPANLIYTATTNQTVKLRITGVVIPGVTQLGIAFGGSIDGSSYATIKQIGTSALTTSPNSTPVVSIFTTNGTFTPTTGMKWCVVEMVGGGGGGQSTSGSAANTIAVGAGGGAGGYVKALLTAAQIGASQSVTIGAGGAATVAGGNTTLGALLTAFGGASNGTVGPTQFNGSSGGLGGGFTVATGIDLGSLAGMQGQGAIGYAIGGSQIAIQGAGGDSMMGQGGRGFAQGSSGAQSGGGGAQGGPGGGGGGAISAQGGGAGTGSAGVAGKVVITQYFGAFLPL